MITQPQIKLIHSLKSAMKLPDEHYRALLGAYKVNSSVALSYESAVDLITRMTNTAIAAGVWTVKPGPAAPRGLPFDDLGERPGMASPAQLRKICVMWDMVTRAHGADDRRKALNSFLGHQFGISFLQWLPMETVRKVITALEVMINTKQEQEISHDNHTADARV